MQTHTITVDVPEEKLGELLAFLFTAGLPWAKSRSVVGDDPVFTPTFDDREAEVAAAPRNGTFTVGHSGTTPLTGKALDKVLDGMTEFPHGTRFDGPGVRVMMKRASLTGTEVANLLGVDQSTVSGWLCGRARPNIGMARELAELLGVPLGQIARIYPATV